jgi:hypothetical protein
VGRRRVPGGTDDARGAVGLAEVRGGAGGGGQEPDGDVTDQIIAGKAEGRLCSACCAARTLMMRSDRQVYRSSTGVVAMVTSDDFTLVRELHRMVPKRRVVTPEP